MQPSSEKIKKVFSVFLHNYREIPLIPIAQTPFQILVLTLLSARTRDEITARAGKRLFKKAPNPERLARLSSQEIEKLIYPVGFYKTKAKNIKQLAKVILYDFDKKVPRSFKSLRSLPGVGRKTANITLARAFHIPAIGVDTHVHRIANMLGWVKTKTPEQTEKKLMAILPKKYWSKTNKLFVSIGRQYRSEGQLRKFLQKNHLLT